MRYTWRLLIGAVCAAIALGLMAGPAAAALSDGSSISAKAVLLDDDDVDVCLGHECEELDDVDEVHLSVYAWFLNSSRQKPDSPKLIKVACPIGAEQGVAVAAVAEEDGWLYVLAAAKGKSDFSDVDVVSTVNLGPELEWVRGGEVVLITACADTKDRRHGKDRHRDDGRDKHRDKDKDGRDKHRDKDRDHKDKDDRDKHDKDRDHKDRDHKGKDDHRKHH